MGTVQKLFEEPERDFRGRIILAVNQKWVERKTGVIWIVEDFQSDIVNDRVRSTKIYLEDLDGIPCDSVYTEEYFREWFYEISEVRRKNNRAVLRKSRPKRQIEPVRLVAMNGKKI